MTGLTIIDSSFSFTLFVRPSTPLRACSLIFLSSTSDISDASQAKPYLGIDPSGRLVAELPPNIVVTSPVKVSIDQWNHVAVSYSFSQNKLSLYHNGSLQTSATGPTPHYNPPVTAYPIYVTLANPLAGLNGTAIAAQPFVGAIDEFNIWSRALNASEVYAAAYPI